MCVGSVVVVKGFSCRDPWRTAGREDSGAGLEENLQDLKISEE